MKSNFLKALPILIGLTLLMTGCTMQGKKTKVFKHDTPLIKTDGKELGKKELEKSAEMGPVPIEADVVKLKKRKKISSVKQKNYLLIPDEFRKLKQKVTFRFENMDYREAMTLMAKVGGINILVGEDVAGAISAELIDVPWDKAFNALLDKNFREEGKKQMSGAVGHKRVTKDFFYNYKIPTPPFEIQKKFLYKRNNITH